MKVLPVSRVTTVCDNGTKSRRQWNAENPKIHIPGRAVPHSRLNAVISSPVRHVTFLCDNNDHQISPKAQLHSTFARQHELAIS